MFNSLFGTKKTDTKAPTNGYRQFSVRCEVQTNCYPSFQSFVEAAFPLEAYLGIGLCAVSVNLFPEIKRDKAGIEFESFMAELNFNSIMDEDVTSGPGDSFDFNQMSSHQIQILNDTLDTRAKGSIGLGQAEGELMVLMAVKSAMTLVNFIYFYYIQNEANNWQNNQPIADMPFPDIDFEDENSWKMWFETTLTTDDGNQPFAGIDIPILPPFGLQMSVYRQSLLDALLEMSPEWHSFFKEVFEKAENDYKFNPIGKL